MKLYAVNYVEYGDSCDGKARTIGIFTNEDEAKGIVKIDIDVYVKSNQGNDWSVDYDKMCAWCDDSDVRCEWNIDKVLVADEVLVANVCMN